MAPDNTPIRVDVWSDVACPWCYIGKRNLESGITGFFATPVEVVYHSFELAPDTPVEFTGSEVEFLMSHRGVSADQARAMIDRVVGIARSAGFDYDYDALQHTNTLKAHELLHYAKERGLQLEMNEQLLSAYFVEGRHVGRIEDLTDLGAEVVSIVTTSFVLSRPASMPNLCAPTCSRLASTGLEAFPFSSSTGGMGSAEPSLPRYSPRCSSG